MSLETINEFAKGLSNLGRGGCDNAWPAFAASAAAAGFSRIVVAKWQRLTPIASDEVLFSNLASDALERVKQSFDGTSPLRRMAWRQGEPFLLSRMRPLDPKLARVWLNAFRAGSDSDLFVIPARRRESLLSVVFVTGPETRFDPLTCAMLTVTAHAAAFRSEREVVAGEDAALTAREAECLELTALGRGSREIADVLRISTRTVRFHLDNAREKLSVATRAAATRKAVALGLINGNGTTGGD